jgi:hypothetical protein
VNNKWYHPSRINQSILRPISDTITPLSALIGIGVGVGTANPFYGALAGGGLAAILGAPTLINEAQATGYAKKYLDDSNHTQQTIKQNKKTLNRAYGTYLSSAIMYPAVAGALFGGYAKLKE